MESICDRTFFLSFFLSGQFYVIRKKLELCSCHLIFTSSSKIYKLTLCHKRQHCAGVRCGSCHQRSIGV